MHYVSADVSSTSLNSASSQCMQSIKAQLRQGFYRIHFHSNLTGMSFWSVEDAVAISLHRFHVCSGYLIRCTKAACSIASSSSSRQASLVCVLQAALCWLQTVQRKHYAQACTSAATLKGGTACMSYHARPSSLPSSEMCMVKDAL